MVEVGDPAPSFELTGVSPEGEIRTYSLDELTAGTPLAMVVYAYDFSPVCTDQMCSIDDMEFLTFTDGVRVVGVSGDGPYSHKKFANEHSLSYPLLADTDRSVCADYGVLNTIKDGANAVPQRSLFLIDPEQRIRYKWVAGDNWDTWSPHPLQELKRQLDDL